MQKAPGYKLYLYINCTFKSHGRYLWSEVNLHLTLLDSNSSVCFKHSNREKLKMMKVALLLLVFSIFSVSSKPAAQIQNCGFSQCNQNNFGGGGFGGGFPRIPVGFGGFRGFGGFGGLRGFGGFGATQNCQFSQCNQNNIGK